jgi:hypothetical protein
LKFCTTFYSMFRSHRTVGRAKPPARHFDVAQVLRGVPAVGRFAGNGASFNAFRQQSRVRLLPALAVIAPSPTIRAFTPVFDGLWGEGSANISAKFDGRGG